jgi:ribosomal-protein-alanine N-acetyltransferase
MSYVPESEIFSSASLLMATMRAQDVEEVVAIENQAYPFPWSRGNFLDSLNSGYDAWVMRELDGQIAGYFLVMPVVDEMHLLNITVRPTLQGKKLGRLLLNKVITLAREAKMQSILLEVRPSNPRALAFYQHVGFEQIGIRKNYYPWTGATREDAIVMRLMIMNQDHEA